jgi:hypothetical protein
MRCGAVPVLLPSDYRGKAMRTVHPSHLLLPLMFILTGTLLVMGHLDIIQIARYQQLWPVTIIAAGIEELYRWATFGKNR